MVALGTLACVSSLSVVESTKQLTCCLKSAISERATLLVGSTPKGGIGNDFEAEKE